MDCCLFQHQTFIKASKRGRERHTHPHTPRVWYLRRNPTTRTSRWKVPLRRQYRSACYYPRSSRSRSRRIHVPVDLTHLGQPPEIGRTRSEKKGEQRRYVSNFDMTYQGIFFEPARARAAQQQKTVPLSLLDVPLSGEVCAAPPHSALRLTIWSKRAGTFISIPIADVIYK